MVCAIRNLPGVCTCDIARSKRYRRPTESIRFQDRSNGSNVINWRLPCDRRILYFDITTSPVQLNQLILQKDYQHLPQMKRSMP